VTQNWIEVRIESSVDSGELLDQLDDPTVTGPWQENGVIRLFWPADRWNPDVLQDIRQGLREIGKEMEQPAITVDSLPDQDWTVEPCRSQRACFSIISIAAAGSCSRECALSIRLKSLTRLQRQVEWCSTRGSVTGGWRLK